MISFPMLHAVIHNIKKKLVSFKKHTNIPIEVYYI